MYGSKHIEQHNVYVHYQCFCCIQNNYWDYFTHLPRLMKHLSVRGGKMERGREDEAVSLSAQPILFDPKTLLTPLSRKSSLKRK